MSKKNSTSLWDKNRGTFRTNIGGWVLGEAVYNHGYSMLDELVGTSSFFQVLILNATGRLPEKRLAEWVEASFICLSWPDPRIWCNKIGTFAGNMRCSPAAAVSMGILAADSRMYAAGAIEAGCNFITNAYNQKKLGLSTQDIINQEIQRKTKSSKSKAVIMGYARPLATGDERIPAMERVSKQLSFQIGPHLSLAYEIDEILRKEYDESMNMLGYCVAFLSDQGFNANEAYLLYSTWVNSGVHACFAEARDNPPESFLPLRCEDIKYTGPNEREVPES